MAAPSTPLAKVSRRGFFSRSSRRRQKESIQHVGKSNNVQAFYEAPDFDEKDPKWVEHAPMSLPKVKKDKYEGAAIQTYQRRNPANKHESFYVDKIRLQSPYLREALEDTLEKYGLTWKDDLVAESIAPHRALYFAHDYIAELTKTADKEEVRSHCELLCTVVEDVFEETVDKLEALEEEMITYELLWTMFPEGSLWAEQNDSVPPKGLRVKKIDTHSTRLKLTTEIIHFDGYRYGTTEWEYRAYAFDGAVHISAIPGLPFIDLSQNHELRLRLLERGRRALELQSINYMTYKPNVPADDASMKNPWLREEEKQRVVIDPHLYRLRKRYLEIKHLPYYKRHDEENENEMEDESREVADRKEQTNEKAQSRPVAKYQLQKVSSRARGHSRDRHSKTRRRSRSDGGRYGATRNRGREGARRPTKAELEENRKAVLEQEENLIIMCDYVLGYSTDKQAWMGFYLDNLHPADVDVSVFEKVVLEETKKDVIKTLVESHKERQAHYDDLISGKGQCLLILLSGPPGTGKTLLAESLAEHLGCPLLRADPQYFDPHFMDVIQGYESTLSQFLKDATEWGGLVLFDEPDFLFQNQDTQSGNDRNALLAFLRHAEYYKGIIVLTTNLTRTIDPAVISRAQIHISFPSLTETSRVHVWENFIERLPNDIGTLSPQDINHLAAWQINGREIKNILNMSVSWCRKKKSLLTLQIIESLLTTICPSAKKVGDSDTANGINSTGLEDMFSLLND
ncbi:hypothetical protein B0H63DRAFT_473361 [Podospora didyma]|uniref:AAA+ ATPase domain-containing protein n=1 Tax=Podospora didyma TaxID=330526 RepID=A0AAE0NQ51_9PEZI|nr:hypothetical protein B0H63DRAFT_473361 [Podospora didyma]